VEGLYWRHFNLFVSKNCVYCVSCTTDIYHVLKDSCDYRIPDNKILPEREDLLQFLQRKMLDHEVHEHLIQLVENLPAADTFLAESGLFHVFNDPKESKEALCGRHHLFGAENLESLQGSSTTFYHGRNGKRRQEQKEELK
jgi:hypothetical protein